MTRKFKLFECCIPVMGASRSTICDIQRNKIKFIPNLLCEILENFDGQSKHVAIDYYGKEHDELISEYYDFLVEHEFGFWTDTPELFPKMDRTFETPQKINNGIIDIDKHSKHDFKSIFWQYDQLGCKHIQLRFFCTVELSLLEENLKFLDKSVVNSVELILKYNPKISPEQYRELGMKIPRIFSIQIHSATKDEEVFKTGQDSTLILKYFTERLNSNSHCGNISQDYFVIEQNTLMESLSFNSCLNKKISIDVNGEIKNCPSMNKIYGNIKNLKLIDALKMKNFKKLWGVNKDQIDVCKDCEFRHICTDCRAFLGDDDSLAKPKKCTYSPYTMEWED